MIDRAAFQKNREAWIQALKEKTGLTNMKELLAMSTTRDPFNIGTDEQFEKAQWFASIWNTHYQGQTGVHIRRIHYKILGDVTKQDGTRYQNLASDWNELQECCRCARLLGYVPADAFEDRRNPEPEALNWHSADEEEQVHVRESYELWALPEARLDFSLWELPLRPPRVEGYQPDDYQDRVYMVELWIEKSTMNDILKPLANELGIRLVTSSGYQSITNAVKLCQRVREMQKPTRIFYVSDYDLAGNHMPIAVARQIEYWRRIYAPESDIKLQSLALTAAQIEKYQLPTSIENSDAVELDALEARHPGALAEIVRHAVEPYLLDDSIVEELAETKQEAEELVEREWEQHMQELEERREALETRIRTVTKKYEKEAAAFNKRLQRDLGRFRKPLYVLQDVAREQAAQFSPDLPERPRQGESEHDAESDWLFDASRDEVEQLRFYKARRGGEP